MSQKPNGTGDRRLKILSANSNCLATLGSRRKRNGHNTSSDSRSKPLNKSSIASSPNGRFNTKAHFLRFKTHEREYVQSLTSLPLSFCRSLRNNGLNSVNQDRPKGTSLCRSSLPVRLRFVSPSYRW